MTISYSLSKNAFSFLLVTGYCCDRHYQGAEASDNGLALTPAMGWNSWNKFHCNINEDLITDTADALIKLGLDKLGYEYINLDDCWQMKRNATGYIVEDFKKFPAGIDSLAKKIHSKGLKFGLYSDAGTHTCQGRPGSLNYEFKDAAVYKEWNIDYLKYDNCWSTTEPVKQRFHTVSFSFLLSIIMNYLSNLALLTFL
jgi:alpha-galactosidase